MRRREKFVVAAILLSLSLLGVQYVDAQFRYFAILGLTILSYLISAFALSDDLQWHEWFTIIPLPSMFAGSVALFYFLLPENLLSRVLVGLVFAIGMYAIFLTANIYSVAKGRTIQLLYAAHAVGLLVTLMVSLLLTNTIFSLNLLFYLNALLVGLVHFPLVLMSLWSINLEPTITREITAYSLLVTVFLGEFAAVISFLPLPVWNSSLFVTGLVYIALGVLHSFLRGRLFKNTIQEYTLVAVFLSFLFLLLFPWK